MCEYCSNGKYRSGKMPIVDMDLDLGILGKSRLAMYIRTLKTGATLDAVMDNYGYSGETATTNQRILYCPMCGIPLTDE